MQDNETLGRNEESKRNRAREFENIRTGQINSTDENEKY